MCDKSANSCLLCLSLQLLLLVLNLAMIDLSQLDVSLFLYLDESATATSSVHRQPLVISDLDYLISVIFSPAEVRTFQAGGPLCSESSRFNISQSPPVGTGTSGRRSRRLTIDGLRRSVRYNTDVRT